MKVLIVDDEEALLTLLRLHLEDSFQVEVSSDENDALLKIQENQYDVVVSDYSLGRVKSDRIISAAKAKGMFSVLMTGYFDKSSEADAVLRKPFDIKILYILLKNLEVP